MPQRISAEAIDEKANLNPLFKKNEFIILLSFPSLNFKTLCLLSKLSREQ